MEAKPLDRELTDGTVILRRAMAADADVLVAGRDVEFHRFLGAGSPDPRPAAVVLNNHREIVGWIDYDVDRDWLGEGEVNVGYGIFPEPRGQGFATRSLALLLDFLSENVDFTAATLLIDPENSPSIAVAERAGFCQQADVSGQIFYKRLARR